MLGRDGGFVPGVAKRVMEAVTTPNDVLRVPPLCKKHAPFTQSLCDSRTEVTMDCPLASVPLLLQPGFFGMHVRVSSHKTHMQPLLLLYLCIIRLNVICFVGFGANAAFIFDVFQFVFSARIAF